MSAVICIENQVTLGADETIVGKLKFDEWHWNHAEVEIKHFRGDNGIFTADFFKGIARININIRVFLVLERSIIMLNPRGPFKILHFDIAGNHRGAGGMLSHSLDLYRGI